MPDLSLVVCAHDMERELPRTLFSLCPPYQRLPAGLSCEILVIDCGSARPVEAAALSCGGVDLRVLRVPACPSPAAAINAAMAETRGQLVGLWIDGARLSSPGLLARAVEAWRADPSRAIGTLAFHLGPDVQMRSVGTGYDRAAEDALLASVPWRKDGYRLFDISVLAGSSAEGWFGCISETNGLFLDRKLWDRLGGLDERFHSPGGGYVNLDLWQRAVALSGDEPWIVLGEGTFHQVHGGAATNGTAAARKAMAAEYETLIGRPHRSLVYRPRLIGTLSPTVLARGSRPPPEPPRRVQSVGGRAFRIALPPEVLDRVQAGTLRTRYRGLRFAKNPFDIALYLRLIEALAPATIIEIGTSEGGSAVWFRDQCRTLGLQTGILSLDLKRPPLEEEGIRFLAVDSTDPAGTFPTDLIDAAPRPWLVIEDSAHTYESVAAVLSYFDPRLQPGDRLVVEDGVVADMRAEAYRRYDDGPNRAVAEFLLAHPGRYRIDAELCDFYGPNVTWCPNAWLERI
ncbi:CmcI family methyltransferase [Rhodobacter sp. CZR27]|uniref:CmcI family methyltransferase n=1 Tax=Rhodobacter sp. CZR27 TaxID=2033869 RepID=UPI000BBE7A41|nr:CmcI family methyltransferase [Rhodobacter sp. CZR27]